MKKIGLALIGATLCAGAATPAFADYDRIGTISVDAFADRSAHPVDLGGPVQALQLRADGNDVQCKSVTARFGNGNTRQIFSGRLYSGRSTGVDLPGNDRNVTRLSFTCRSIGPRANIVVSADIGNYRDQWRRSPNWASVWAHTFAWAMQPPPPRPGYMPPPPPRPEQWAYAGQVNFQGRDDRDSVFGGWRGQKADRIAIKTNAPLRCTRVLASFGNGNTRDISLRNGGYVMPGQYYELDLPGETRRIVNLDLRCHPTASFSAQAQIFTVQN